MTTPFPFVSGQVLTAAQLNDIQNLPISDKTASYTLIAGDETKRTIMNSASATTITVNNSIFTVGDVIQVANKGAGTCTITAGAGVTINTTGTLDLAQYGGGYLLALSASTFTFFKLGGAAISTLAVDFMLSGGGGGGGRYVSGAPGGGGGAGGFVTGTSILGKTTYVVKIGAGGAGSTSNNDTGRSGTASGFINTANGGGGGGGIEMGRDGASGGGGGDRGGGGTGISGEGNAGGALSATGGGGGGGSGSVGGAGGANGGTGGTAATNSYTGSSISYSGGGGGGGASGGSGGAGGTNAGTGGTNSTGGNATANRGGGGGGSGGAANGGNGGSGQVVIRYLTADAAGFTITTTGSPTTGTSGAYSFIQYTATGTLVIA
jgi:hypothetical protein